MEFLECTMKIMKKNWENWEKELVRGDGPRQRIRKSTLVRDSNSEYEFFNS